MSWYREDRNHPYDRRRPNHQSWDNRYNPRDTRQYDNYGASNAHGFSRRQTPDYSQTRRGYDSGEYRQRGAGYRQDSRDYDYRDRMYDQRDQGYGRNDRSYVPSPRQSPSDRDSFRDRGVRVDRRYSPSDKGYSPREPGYSAQRDRRPDSGSERQHRLPDESRNRSSRHEVPETSRKTTTVSQSRGRYDREPGRSHKESRHSSTVHSSQESDDFIVIDDEDVDERRVQDYACEPNVKEESQTGGPGESLSFDEHLKQLSFVNVLAQTMNRNPGINESTGSVISNSNSEELSNQNATQSDFVPSVPQTPSDSNPVFQNAIPSGAENHPDNETVQVGTANVAAVDIGPPEHAPGSLQSPSVDDKSKQLRKVEGNINDLLSKIQTKIVSERKASKVKSDKATKKDKSPGSNLSKATLPGFEDWNDKDSDLDRSIIDLVSADEDEDFRIGKYKSGSNREGLQTAQETPYNNEDLMDNADFEDVDYRRDIHSDEYHMNEDSKTTPGSERDFQSKGNQNDDVEQKVKHSSDTTKQASMTQEELMLEFQRRWDQERKVKEGKQPASTGKSGASDHEEAEKRIMEQVQQEFKKRWDNEQNDLNETVVMNEDEGVTGEQELNTPRQTINQDEKEQNLKYQDRNKQRQWQRQQEGNRNWNETRSPAQFNRQDSGDLRNARGSFHNRGGFHNDRGGFQNCGSFHNDCRGFHNKRGGFHNERGGFHNDRGNRNFNDGFQNKYDRQDNGNTTARPFQNQFNRQGSGGFHSNSGNQQTGNKFNKSNYGKNLDKNASSSQSKDKSKGIIERTEKQSCKDNKESEDSHKTPRKSIKEFKIPKLGKKKEDSKKVQHEESQKVKTPKEATVKTSPTDSILKTIPKELKDKDSKIRVKEKLVSDKIKDQTVSDVKSESLSTSSAGSKEPTTNIFEKLTLEITPPKKVKNNALNEHSGVEKSVTKEQSGEKSVVSIKKDTKPSGDGKDGQKQHDKVLKHVEKVKEQSSASTGNKEKKFAEKKLAEKKLADKKKKSIEIIEEDTNSSSDSNSSGIFGKMELYIGKGKASSKEDVKSSEKQSKSDKKDRKEEKRVKDSKNKNHFGIRGLKRINGQLYWKTFKLLQPKIVLKKLTPREIAKKSKRKNSSDIKDKNTKEKSSKGFSMVKDTNKTLKILSDREDFSPVKAKKKSVRIVSESESDLSPVQAKKKVAPILSESEELSPIKAKKKSTHILSDSEENPSSKEGKKNDEELSDDFSPMKPKQKPANVLLEREDISPVKQNPTAAVVQSESDNENSESENEDSDALMDEIKDGGHMEIGSDVETQEVGQYSEQEKEEMGDTFEDDIGSAIAESLESAELLDPDLDTLKEVEMECSATGHCDKRSQESNPSSFNQSKKESPKEEKKEKATSSYASSDTKVKNNKKPDCTVTVTLEDEEEEEEEQSQSLFQDEPKSKMVCQLMSISSDESEKEKSGEDRELVDISKKANPADHMTKTVSKDDSSGDDLPEIRIPKLTPRTRVVSRKSLEGKDSHEENKTTESQITPRKRKLFKHNKTVTPVVEESGNDGDVEDNDVVFDEPTQAYEETANFDEPTQTFDEPTQNYDEPTQSYDKGDKVSDNDNQKDDDGLDSPSNDTDIKSDEIDGDKLQVKDEPDWLKNGYTQEPDTVFISEDEDNCMIMSISQPIICLDTSDSDSDDVKDRKKVTKVSSKKVTVKKEMNLDGEGVNDPEYWEISSPDNDSDRGSDFEADDFFRMISRLSETAQPDSEEEKEESLNELDMSIFSDEDDNLLEETQKQSTDLNDAQDSTENELIKSKPKQKFRRESGDVAAEQSSKDDKDMIHSQQSQVHPTKSGKKAERQTTREHSDGVEIIIEDMDDDESLDSSWSDDSYMSDLDVQQMMEQATQKVADTEEQTKGKDSATDKVEKQQIKTSTDTEKGNKDDSNLNKKQYESETQSFDSDKTIEYSAETQIDEEGSVTSEDETQVMADDDYYMQETQVDREDSHETSDQQAETQVADTDMDDHYTAETQVDETQSEADEEGQIADYTAKTQTINDPSASEFEAETQVDDVNDDLYGAETQVDNQDDDQYQAQTQVVQDSMESDDSNEAEYMYNDPQYEMYIQKGNNETPVGTNNKLGIKLDHSFSEDATNKEKKNKDKESTDSYTVETQPISPVEKDTYSDNENDPCMEQTQVEQMNLPEVESISDDENDVYMEQTQIDGKQVESTKSSSEDDDVYMEPTQIDREQLQSSESDDANDAYMAETQVDADEMDLPDLETFSDNDRDVYMEQTQIDTEPVTHTTDPADAYCDLTQDDDAERYKQDYDSNRNKKIQETRERNEIKSGSFKTSLETVTKDSFKKGMLSLKKGIQKLIYGKRTYSFDTDSQRKLIELPKSDAPDDVGVSSAKKSRMDNHGNNKAVPNTHGKAQSRENSTLSNDGQRKSIMIEPLPSTSFYKPPSDKCPPPRSQSFLDANKGITVSDATKDDTWLSKKSSKDKGKGKSGKRRRNKSSDSAADMSALISKARQGFEERRMKFKSNPDCIADPAKKLKHQTSSRSLDEEQDVELPSLSQVIDKGYPILDQSMLMKSKQNKEPTNSTIDVHVTTSTSTIVTSTVSMATSTCTTTTGSTVHVSIPSTSASTSNTTISASGVDRSQSSDGSLKSKHKSSDKHSGVSRSDSRERDHNTSLKHSIAHKYVDGTQSHTGDKHHEHSGDKYETKSGHEHSSVSDKHSTDKHLGDKHASKSKDQDKLHDKHSSDSKDKYKTGEKKKSSDKHGSSSDHKANSKHRHGSGSKHSPKDKYKQPYSNKSSSSDKSSTNVRLSTSDQLPSDKVLVSDKPPTIDKPSSSGENHPYPDKANQDKSIDKHKDKSDKHKHESSDKHKDKSDKHKDKHSDKHKDKSSDKHENKDVHKSSKHKHKSGHKHKHDKDGDRKHHKSKDHESERGDGIKSSDEGHVDKRKSAGDSQNSVDKDSSAIHKHSDNKKGSKSPDNLESNSNKGTSKTVSALSGSKENGSTYEKESDNSVKLVSEDKQHSINKEVDALSKVVISVTGRSSPGEDNDKHENGKKDKGKVSKDISSPRIGDNQVPSTSKDSGIVSKMPSGSVLMKKKIPSENKKKTTTGIGLQSCLTGKLATAVADQKKKQRTVTWGRNTVHGIQGQGQTSAQNKVRILSTSAESLMQKITIGAPPPIVQPVTYPPDLMKIKDNDRVTWEKIIVLILKWNPVWFEERDKMELSGVKKCLPPSVTDDFSQSGLFQLVDKYISLEEYVNKFMMPLLLHETWQTMYTDWREKKNRGKLHKLYLLLNQQNQQKFSERLQEFEFIGVMTREEKKHWVTSLNDGELITLRIYGREKPDGQAVMKYILAIVVKVLYMESRKDVDKICEHAELGKLRKLDSVGVMLTVRVRKRLFTPHGLPLTEIQSVSSLVSTKRQVDALAYFPQSPLCRDLLFPSSSQIYSDRAVASLPHDRKKLNQSQSVAVNTVVKVASRVATGIPRICLLQGPPGTGKSFTIINIVRRIVQEKKGQCSICLTAPSHAAVDELLRKIHKQNIDPAEKTKVNLVRLGKKHSVHSDVQCYCLDNLVQRRLLDYVPQSLLAERNTLDKKIAAIKENIKSTKDEFKRKKWSTDLRKLQKDKENLEAQFLTDRVNPGQEKRAKSEILNGAHVIAGTLSSMGSNLLKTFLSQKNTFDCVIVDEATQAIEVDTLIPLQYGVSKLVLVGDPEQLCPTVLSQLAQDHKLNMSLFQRLDSHFRYSTDSPNPIIFLDTQYRMDREIASFPNNYIYEGRLKSETPIIKLNLVPYLLFDMREGEEQFSQGSRSMSNQMEAVFTAELCKLILGQTKFGEKSIGIIAPYAKQKDEILKQLAIRGMKQIEVSTVDGFQGREKHIVIMSCVRAVSGSLGFVGNRNRMNVALTRAKYAMYLVGHFGALESSDEWKALIADARQRNKIVNVTIDTYKDDTRYCLKGWPGGHMA